MKKIILLCLSPLLLFLTSCSVAKIELKMEAVTIEAGSYFDPLDYLTSSKSGVKIFSELNDSVPGEYLIKYGTGDNSKNLKVIVQDTIAPRVTTKKVTILYGETFTADMFVNGIDDETEVVVKFKETPNFQYDGENLITTLVLTDLGGNVKEVNATYSIDGEEAFISDYLDRAPKVIAKFWSFNKAVDNYSSSKEEFLKIANEFIVVVENMKGILQINQYLRVRTDVLSSVDYHLIGINEVIEGLEKGNQTLVDAGYDKLEVGQLILDKCPTIIEQLRK